MVEENASGNFNLPVFFCPKNLRYVEYYKVDLKPQNILLHCSLFYFYMTKQKQTRGYVLNRRFSYVFWCFIKSFGHQKLYKLTSLLCSSSLLKIQILNIFIVFSRGVCFRYTLTFNSLKSLSKQALLCTQNF